MQSTRMVKRILLILMLLCSFSYGSNIVEVISDIEQKNAELDIVILDLAKTNGDDKSKNKLIIKINTEIDNLLENILQSLKSDKAYASMSVSYESKRKELLDNIKDSKSYGNRTLPLVYRDELLLSSLELDNMLVNYIGILKTLIETAQDKAAYKEYLKNIISSIELIEKNDISDYINNFISKQKDANVKKYNDVKNNYRSFILKKDANLRILNYLLENVDTLSSKDEVLGLLPINRLSNQINEYFMNQGYYFEKKYYIFKEEIIYEDSDKVSYKIVETMVMPSNLVTALLMILFLPIPLWILKVKDFKLRVFPGYWIFIVISKVLEKITSKLIPLFVGDKEDFVHKTFSSVRKPALWLFTTIVISIMLKLFFFPKDIPNVLNMYIDFSHLFTFIWFITLLLDNISNKLKEEILKRKAKSTPEYVDYWIEVIKTLLAIGFVFTFIHIAIPEVVNYFAGAGFLIAFLFKDGLMDYYSRYKVVKNYNLKVGDWCKDLLKGYEGVVHSIDKHDTTFILFEGSRLTIPNTYLAKAHILNYSRRSGRQIKFYAYFSIGICPIILKKIVDEYNAYLNSHKNLRHEEDVKGMNSHERRENGISTTCFAVHDDVEHGARVWTYVNTNKDNWMFQLFTKQDLLLQLKTIARKHGTDLVIKGNPLAGENFTIDGMDSKEFFEKAKKVDEIIKQYAINTEQ